MPASNPLSLEEVADDLPPALKLSERAGRTVRVAVLTRLSKETDETTSPQRQREDCLRLAAGQGWSCDPDRDIYEDTGSSGWQEGVKRPGLDRLMAKLGDYDVIVFWKLDRTFRSLKRFIAFVEECEGAGVGLVSVQERHIDTTSPWGRFVALLFMLLAQLEAETTSVRQKSAQAWLYTHGYWAGGPAPFGWRIVKTPDHHAKLALHDVDAKALRSVVAKILEGSSLGACARWLNEGGRYARRNANGKARKNQGSCRANTLKALLTSPVLLGHQVHKGEVLTDERGVPVVAHEPLVDYWTWTRLQEQLASNRVNGLPEGAERSSNESMLRSLLRCATCGSTMGAGAASYGCRTSSLNPSRCGESNWINRAGTEELVTGLVLGRLDVERLAEARALLEAERELLADPDPDAQRRMELAQQLERLEEDRLEGMYDGDTAKARYRAQYVELTAELDRLGETKTTPGLATLAALDEVADLAGRWDDLDVHQRRSIIGAAIDRIVVRPRTPGAPKRFEPDRITVHWTDGTETTPPAPAEPTS